jgi:hypothetical protein
MKLRLGPSGRFGIAQLNGHAAVFMQGRYIGRRVALGPKHLCHRLGEGLPAPLGRISLRLMAALYLFTSSLATSCRSFGFILAPTFLLGLPGFAIRSRPREPYGRACPVRLESYMQLFSPSDQDRLRAPVHGWSYGRRSSPGERAPFLRFDKVVTGLAC